MDTFTFISKIVDALAWPSATILIIFMLKKPLSKILLRLSHLKYKDLEFDFGKALTEINDSSALSNDQLPISATQLKLAELSPRGAILESWIELEEMLIGTAKVKGFPIARPGGVYGKSVLLSTSELARSLTASRVISTVSYERLEQLKNIRNKAIHVTDESLEQKDAEAFIRLVAEIKLELSNSLASSQA
jgi:hypothetical protein